MGDDALRLEGNRRSGVALAMRHRQITTYGLMSLGREMTTPPKLLNTLPLPLPS